MAEIASGSTGLSGEYFVAAELYRRGWLVGMTIGNAKSVDLYAEKYDRKIAVQVKAIYKKANIGWTLMKDKVKEGCFYILVNLNGDKMTLPDYYVLTSQELVQKIKQYSTRGIVNLSEVNSPDFRDRWNKLEENILQ